MTEGADHTRVLANGQDRPADTVNASERRGTNQVEQRPQPGAAGYGSTAESGFEPRDFTGAPADPASENHRPAITGTVAHADGSPVTGATLTLATLQGGQVDRGSTDDAGTYRLLPPTGGSYIVICMAGDSQPRAALVAVADRAVRHDVELAGASTVHGTVGVGGASRGAADVVVTLTDASGTVVAATTTGESGMYAFGDLTEGAYTLTAASVDYQPVATALSIPSGGRVEKDIELAGRCQLAGTVRASSSGKPVDEALVTLIDGAGAVVGAVPTGADGTYVFDNLPEGAYTLTAAGYAPVATAVDLTPGAASDADITLVSPRSHE